MIRTLALMPLRANVLRVRAARFSIKAANLQNKDLMGKESAAENAWIREHEKELHISQRATAAPASGPKSVEASTSAPAMLDTSPPATSANTEFEAHVEFDAEVELERILSFHDVLQNGPKPALIASLMSWKEKMNK